MNRSHALAMLKENVSQPNIIKHCLAVEAIMKTSAEELKEDAEKWSIVGLLHDIDYEKTMDDLNRHTYVAAEMLDGVVGDEIIRAIRSHGFWYTGVQPESKMEYILIASDAVSGLIIAVALMMPSRKLGDVDVAGISKKFRRKDFARNCDRGRILYCEKANVPLERFFELSLEALRGIAHELGL